MPTRQQLLQGIDAAEKAGDYETAKLFAQKLGALSKASSKPLLPDMGSLSEGAKLRLSKQLVGAQQIGSDIGRMVSGEMGQPYSPYRQSIQKRGEELIQRGKNAPPLTQAGDIGMMALESMAIPYGAVSTAGRVGLNALLGGAQTGLQPYSDPAQRAQETAVGALGGAVLPEVLGPMTRGLSGIARYTKGIVSPRYGAIREIERETGGAQLPSELSSAYGNAPPPGQAGPTLPPFGRVPGVRPTVGMITDDPRLLELEMNARNRAPAGFMQRDLENQQAIIAGLEQRALTGAEEAEAMQALNAETGALREGALQTARRSPTIFEMTAPLTETMEAMRTRPGEVGRASLPLQTIVSKTEKSALGGGAGRGYDMPDPSDLYAARKQIDDALRGMAGQNDELANAIKSNRKGALELKSAIDEGLNLASQGQWDQYLQTYVTKIKPIEEGRAFADVLDMFKNAPVIPGTTIRSITPYKMRKAASDVTTKEMGTQEIDRLSPSGRGFLDDAAMAMSALENAQKGARATSGSQTATYLTSLMKSGLVPSGGKTASVLNLLDVLGRSRGATALDEALRNPEEFQQLLNAYHSKQAPTGISKLLERTSTNVPEYIKRRFR